MTDCGFQSKNIRMIARSELTLRSHEGYARSMRLSRAVFAVVGLVIIQGTLLQAVEPPPRIPPDDYALYDQIVTKKFLTSDTRLVVLERMTVARLVPNQEGPVTAKLFEQEGYFGGELPSDLVREFVAVNQEPQRLEGRFQFGIRYRFVSGDALEEPEVRWNIPVLPVRVTPAQTSPILDRLAFSRVGRSLRNDQALAYVENLRADGTGAGFLIWFRRQGQEWTLFDTEVVWTVQHQETEENPLLAPYGR